MVTRESDFFFSWNIEKRKFLVEKYKTNDKDEIRKLIQEEIFSKKSLVSSFDPDTQYKIARAKIAIAKAKSIKENQKLLNRKLDAETRIAEYHADNLHTIGHNPSNQAKQAMKHYVEQTKPFDENSIRCPDCSSWQSNSKHPIEWQIDAVTKHVNNFHKRNFTQSEADELAELIR